MKNVYIDERNIFAKSLTFIPIACCAIIHLSSSVIGVAIYIQLCNIHMGPNNQGTQSRAAIDNATLDLKLCKLHWWVAITLF